MGRRKTHIPLNVFINNRLVGQLAKEAGGAVHFKYDANWLSWENSFAISLSLPLRETAYSGMTVISVFDNLLPDNEAIRRKVAEQTGAQGIDSYSLLERIGRDCVGAMQFLPDKLELNVVSPIRGEPLSDTDIETILANLARAPLGIERDHEFRISIAGAQEKTALLFHEGRWMRPIGTTPTTHILKPSIGQIPTAFGMIDMLASVDNEHYCLKLLQAFGLPVANTMITTFGERRVLVVERFDRLWRGNTILRLPQEDCCQALGVPSAQKYQNQGGPSAVDILKLLGRADDPLKDQADFFKSQILFWLIGATDGHAKNFSVFLKPEGRYSLTPFYDVLSAQLAFDKTHIPHRAYKLAMSAGKSRKYKLHDISGRHFVETAREAGLGMTLITNTITDIIENAKASTEAALTLMPQDFSIAIHENINAAVVARLPRLEGVLEEI
jgi:serine/threonine-protein kinase HipA